MARRDGDWLLAEIARVPPDEHGCIRATEVRTHGRTGPVLIWVDGRRRLAQRWLAERAAGNPLPNVVLARHCPAPGCLNLAHYRQRRILPVGQGWRTRPPPVPANPKRLGRVLASVCAHYALTLEALARPGRTALVVEARSVAALALRRSGAHSRMVAGFLNRDPSSVRTAWCRAARDPARRRVAEAVAAAPVRSLLRSVAASDAGLYGCLLELVLNERGGPGDLGARLAGIRRLAANPDLRLRVDGLLGQCGLPPVSWRAMVQARRLGCRIVE